jgi:hypothetical protein
MASWTNIPNANLAAGAPIRSVDTLAIRDNIINTGENARNSQVFLSNGTFTVPPNVHRVKVTVLAAGGNGGTGVVDGGTGGSGGQGGFVVSYVGVTSGGTASVTVGVNSGTRTSSFAGQSTITASGGGNGGNASGSTPGTAGARGAGTIFGQTYYSLAILRSGNTANTTASAGHFTGFGVNGGTRSVTTTLNERHTPIGLGAGGGGGGSASGITAGGIGTNGLVLVEW